MVAVDYLLAGMISVLTGLDRVALVQIMISRPLVAGPLTGWALGNPLVGLEIGMLLELLWLGRLPVGAAIPPDDTQVAVGATVLAAGTGHFVGLDGMPLVLLSVLIAIPLGKFGQVFDKLARHVNDRLAVSGYNALMSAILRRWNAVICWGWSALVWRAWQPRWLSSWSGLLSCSRSHLC